MEIDFSFFFTELVVILVVVLRLVLIKYLTIVEGHFPIYGDVVRLNIVFLIIFRFFS